MTNANKNHHDSHETRIALLEQSIGHISQVLFRLDKSIDETRHEVRQCFSEIKSDMKSDFRWLLGMIIAGNAGLFALMAHAFHWIGA